MDAYAFAYVDSRLAAWGEWCERLMCGLIEPAAVNVIGRLNEGAASAPGHRILCAEMPRSVWITNYLVTKLPDGQHDAVNVWYVFHIRPDGGRWSAQDKAEILGISYEALVKQLQRGRESLARRLLLMS